MDVDAARDLAESLLAEPLPQRWAHVQAVANAAAELAGSIPDSTDAGVIAAWLHDIGYAPALVVTGFHPLDGARYLRDSSWPDDVCRLVANHTDAIRQARELGLGNDLEGEFPDSDGTDRDILWTADARTGPSGERLTIDKRINEIQQRYGPTHFVSSTMRESQPLLEAAEKRVREFTRET